MIDKNIRELVSVRLIRKDEREKVLDVLSTYLECVKGGIADLNDGLPFVWYYPVRELVKDLKEDPDKVIQKGIKDGWIKELRKGGE